MHIKTIQTSNKKSRWKNTETRIGMEGMYLYYPFLHSKLYYTYPVHSGMQEWVIDTLHPNSCFCCFSIPTFKIKFLLLVIIENGTELLTLLNWIPSNTVDLTYMCFNVCSFCDLDTAEQVGSRDSAELPALQRLYSRASVASGSGSADSVATSLETKDHLSLRNTLKLAMDENLLCVVFVYVCVCV